MADAIWPAELEALPHAARVRRAVEIGRQARVDPTAAALLRGWRSGGFTQRLLAAYACHGSRDSAALAELAADASRTISGIAFWVLCHVGDDDALVAALRALPPRRAAKALVRLRRPRPAAVDRFVAGRAEAAEAGEADVWPLVPLASSRMLDRFFAIGAERGGATFWRRLAVLHPARAAAEVVARLDAAANPDGLLFAAARTACAALSDARPDAALAVVAALRRHVPLASIPLRVLASRRPAVVADLVLGGAEAAAVDFERVAPRLGVPRLVALFRRAASYLPNPDRWLARLPGADREAIFRELAPAWTSADGVAPAAILRRLPAGPRAAEARRAVARPELAARPLQRLPYAGLLPWDEAREQTKTWLGHPEAENRAAALVALCEATRFDRARLADLLELLTARKHEQDPVRLAFLGALALLPPGRWRAEHLPALANVVRDALDAADLSGASAAALGRLVFGLLPFHPAWAAERLAEVTRERGYPSWTGRPLTAGEVRRIAPLLTPILGTWLDREHEGRLVALACIVGRRLPLWPELMTVLERLVTGTARPVRRRVGHGPARPAPPGAAASAWSRPPWPATRVGCCKVR